MEEKKCQIRLKKGEFEIEVSGDQDFVSKKFEELEKKYGSSQYQEITQPDKRRIRKTGEQEKPTIGKGERKVGRKRKEDPILEKIKTANIDRTKYPPMDSSFDDLYKSLWILHVMEKQGLAEKLTSPQIAWISTHKLKVRLSRQSVKQRLDTAGSKVNVIPIGKKQIYYNIMEEGVKYLQKYPEETSEQKSNSHPNKP